MSQNHSQEAHSEQAVPFSTEKKSCPSCQNHGESKPAQSCQKQHGSCKKNHGHETEELIHSLKKEIADLKDKYLTSLADLDNYRKRTQREREEVAQVALIHVVEDLLPIIDHFALGLQSAQSSPEISAHLGGFQLIYNQLESLLLKKGIEHIPSAPNTLFNPAQHDGVSHMPHDSIPEDHIIQTTRVGYQWKHRIIRPASVIVSSGPHPKA